MRRREKFVITSTALSLGLFGVQLLPLEWRYVAIGALLFVSYFLSAWALREDLQKHEWLTIVPMSVLYAGSVGLFYFLLPESTVSRVVVLGLFGFGMYALLLTANIYSVAKARNIQLLYAAHAIGLFFTLFTSLLFANTIFSLRLPFYGNGLFISLVHFPLILMSVWSIRLEPRISKELWLLSATLTIMLGELATILSFFPFAVWHSALFIMAFLYLGLGVFHSFLRGRLFRGTLNEYSLLAVFVSLLFLLLFPLK